MIIKKIGIIAALECEVQKIIEKLENPYSEKIAGMCFYCGKIGNHEIVCVQCGIGKVSAALGAQIMVTKFGPDAVINTGCAGALSDKLQVGDTVISDATVEWDLDTIELGNPRGYVSSMDKVKMCASPELADTMAKVIGSREKVFKGMIVSGDQFVSSQEQRNLILSAFPEAICAEMEGAAIGHVCEQNGIPFCVIRCISDNANGDSKIDFAEFSSQALQNQFHCHH